MKNSMLMFLLGAVLVVAQAATITEPKLEQWSNFKIKFNKRYESKAEEQHRMNIFLDTLRKIEEHNAQYEQGLSSFTLTVTNFADWTHAEFLRAVASKPAPTENVPVKMSEVPEDKEEIDWNDPKKNPDGVDAVGDIQDQNYEACKSGWAFAVTAAIEGQYVRVVDKQPPIPNLSEQQIIDCAAMDGCYDNDKKGAINEPIQGFFYLMKKDDPTNSGIELEDDYKYRSSDGNCTEDSSKFLKNFRIIYYAKVSPSESALKEAVKSSGPLTAMMDVSDEKFMHLGEGIYQNDKWDGKQDLTHGLTVIGYGHCDEEDKDYWLIKNSFGENWGDKGFFKLVRNADNNCGIANIANTVEVEKVG